MSKRDLFFYLGLLGVAAAMVIVPPLILAAPLPIGPAGPMAYAQKIFYFHVQVAWLSFASVFVCAGGSVVHLARRSAAADAIAVAASELVLVCGLCTLVTGPLWARKEWGIWWQWKDVRLVSMLILWATFAAYTFVRRYGGPGAVKLASGLALFGAVNVPIVYASVFFWNNLHPKATVVSEGMDPRMRAPFWISFGAFTVLYGLLLAMRFRLERARQRLDEAWLAAQEAGFID